MNITKIKCLKISLLMVLENNKELSLLNNKNNFYKKKLSFSTLWKLIKYLLLKYLLYLNILNLIIKVLKKYYKIVVPMVLDKRLLHMIKWKKYSEESHLNKIKWNLLKLILKPISKLKCPYFMMMTINLMNNKANQLNQ